MDKLLTKKRILIKIKNKKRYIQGSKEKLDSR